MRSTFHGIETALRGLLAQQTAMQTTGHNVANANTQGYSRQVVDFTVTPPMEAIGLQRSTAPGQLGTGVYFSNIRRMRESFLDDQFRNQNKEYGAWTVRQDTLAKLEAIFNEPSDYGIRSVVDEFWNAWQDLANQPDSVTERSVVMEKAIAMTDAFNQISQKLSDLTADINESLTIKVDEVNTYIAQIANLNKEIYRVEGLGDHANDLRDQRDLLTDKLSKLVNINVVESQTGYTITVGSTELVNANQFNPLAAGALPSDITSGEIYGYLVSKNEYLSDIQHQLDQMIRGLVEGEFTLTIPLGTILPEGTTLIQTDGTEISFTGDNLARTVSSDLTVKVKGINGLHQLGYTLTEPLQSGQPFFVTNDGSTNFTAGNIRVNPNIISDVRNIASSTSTYLDGTVEKVVKGNNQLALWMGQLRHTKLTFEDGEGTFDEYFRSMIGRLGVKSQEATRQVENQTILVDQAEGRRQSVSGVSLDEEMANLIKFQHAYNAAARMMTTLDEVLNKLVNGTGVVGR